jgi:hypothetical protein
LLKTEGDVAAPWPTINGWSDDWLAYTETVHRHMKGILNLCVPKQVDRTWWNCPSLWGNDFVCHRAVWDEWLGFWKKSFVHLHWVYGFYPPFRCDPKYDDRKPALLYERVTTLFFALGDYTIHPLSGGIRA